MDRNDIRAKLKEFEGRPGEIAQVVLKMDGAQWDEYNNAVRELCELLMKNSPKTLEAMYDDGPRQIFEAIHGAEVAQWVGQACGRLNLYVHSPSTYRRSFRTADVEPYLRRFASFVEKVFFFWDQCDMLKELTAPAAETREMANKLSHIYGDLLAVRIDNGEEQIIEAVKEIMLGDNNTQLLSHDIVNGIIKSGNKELHSMLGSMLLAAKLQEGLRQTILENADNGRVEAFADLMKIVLDNDLLRYSSAIRAIDVWMGMPYEYDDKRVSSKMLSLGYEFLTGARSTSEAMNSLDTTEIYAALWASSVREMNTAKTLIEQLIKGKKHQVLTGLHFLRQLENESLQSEIASRFLRDTDLDILSSALGNYLTTYIRSIANGFEEDCRSYKVLADDERRSWQFDAIIDIIPLVPTSGYTSSGNPFAWCTLSITPQILFTRLLIIAGYDRDAEKVSRLIDVMAKADSESRLQFLKLFLEEPKNEKERAFVFASLNDKSMSARTQALKNITVFSRHSVLTESEEKAATSLLGLKTGDIRQNVINLLHGLPGDRPKAAAKALLSDKTENKRLAGLDMLTRFVQKDGMPKSEAFELCSLMPKVTDREQLLIDTFVDNKTEYCAANGFGLYDPNYYPDLPFPERSSKHTAKSVFFGDMDKLNAAFDDLCNLIRENKDYTYLAEYYSGNEEVALGALSTVKFRAELEDKELPFLDKFVLPEVWRGWKERNQADTGLLLKFHLLFSLKPYAYSDNAPWVEELLGKFLPIKVSEEFVDSTRKRDYGNLAWSIINCFYEECPKEERFELVYAGFAEMLELISEEDWKRNCGGSRRYFNSNDFTDTLQDNRDIEFLIEELSRTAASDEHFKKFVPICFVLGRYAGLFYANLDAVEVARAVDLGILKVDALYRTMFLSNPRYASDLSGNIREYQKKNVEKYPLLKKVAEEVAVRALEIELRRGDRETEVSALASHLNWHEGAETFAKILVALGSETFVRGYVYAYYGSALTKKSVLSSLLKASHPAHGDSAETLRAALNGKISDKRLLEAAMYAPAWIDIVADYLGWPGLKSAVWYFHAHINESFSAEKETEVARYSPIPAEEFNDGAFDVNWFKDAYKELGEERFAIVYDCAKYLTDGSNHRRAQLFADAALGNLEAKSLWQDIHEKRSKDKLLGYSLIPLKNGQDEALERFENIQTFLQESKSFGAQRRASEGKACSIALENLGRNAGFSDALRFAWRMETIKIEVVKQYFVPKTIGDYQASVKVDESGSASLVITKGEKTLANVPAALKKDPYVIECKEIAGSLKAQHKRAKENLERIMINRDVFSFGEIVDLMEHPVVAPLLQKLAFVVLDSEGKPASAGFYADLAGISHEDKVRIAHPFDFYTLGNWADLQRKAYDSKLTQPFKQVFRELYLINEDEKELKFLSRRYAGHQVQPKKTVALLKSRLWTVDYEEGLQRVYYNENLYVKLYAAADWFSPAEIEAPTLESVEFFNRKTHKPIPLTDIQPIIFSEVMRDIDLVVSVAHVGGVDPEASLSTVEMRAAIVRELLRMLNVQNVSIDGRLAKITGKLGEYTVHLGSAQVHKMGRGAINILAVPSQHRGRIFLPFADDDPRTAEVLSKIILLAEDSKIKDPTVLDQF